MAEPGVPFSADEAEAPRRPTEARGRDMAEAAPDIVVREPAGHGGEFEEDPARVPAVGAELKRGPV
jgi:hypothetical protein